ncbi:MAG: DMT family transporter [Bacteroidales bacterium]|jgi:drug/metabolite transporter (DMT)-like permease|nr:DMT family transporter [Bacteroidales bacterium]
MNSNNKAYLYALIAVLFWGTAASAFKIGLRYSNYLQLLLYSSLTAFIVLFLIIVFQGKTKLLLSIKIYDIKKSIILGFLSPFLYYLILFKAYSLLPAQIAQVLNFVWPITLVLLSIIILKQRLTYRSIIALVISFIGVVFISFKGKLFNFSFSNPFGMFLALGSSVIWALYWLYNVKNKINNIVRLFYNFFFASIFLVFITLIFSSFSINIYGLISAIYIGLFEMAFTYLLWFKALQLSQTTAKVSNLIFLTPFVSLVFINLIIHESIYYTTIIGLVFIILGIVIQQRR